MCLSGSGQCRAGLPGYNRAAAKGSNLKECVCQDLDDAELDYLGIIDPRQRARILKVKEWVYQDLDDAELDYLGIIGPQKGLESSRLMSVFVRIWTMLSWTIWG